MRQSSGETESLGVLVSPPPAQHIHRSGPPGRGGGDSGGGGQASFTARQDLLISRTNSDVLDLEHIYKSSENICEQARDSPPA